jgi:hypothetical protein
LPIAAFGSSSYSAPTRTEDNQMIVCYKYTPLTVTIFFWKQTFKSGLFPIPFPFQKWFLPPLAREILRPSTATGAGAKGTDGDFGARG